MMSPEVREAIEDACDGQTIVPKYSSPIRPIAFERARDLLRRIMDNLPDEMTMSELRDELCHANNQEPSA